MPVRRCTAVGQVTGLAILCGVVYWGISGTQDFVGAGAPNVRPAHTQRHGWRLDNMLERGLKGEDATLEVAEGFWIGEVGFRKSQFAQGLRYSMRASPEETAKGIECPQVLQIGPYKVRWGEIFSGTGQNEKLRELKRRLVKDGQLLTPEKKKENEYWIKRYGHKRHYPKNVDQMGFKSSGGLFRGLAAWSGYDPLNEERGKTWIEADHGKPWIMMKGDNRVPGWITPEQMAKEEASGKLKPAEALKPPTK